MFCQKCNLNYAPGASNCTQCGTALVPSAPPAYGHYHHPNYRQSFLNTPLTKAKVKLVYYVGTILTILVVMLDIVRHIIHIVGFVPFAGQTRREFLREMRFEDFNYAARTVPAVNSILGIFITTFIGIIVMLALYAAAKYLSSTCKD